jgi:hypothetical protein
MFKSMVSDCVYELLPAMGLLFIPQVMSKNHGGMTSTGKTTDSSTRALWQSYQQSSSSKAQGTGEENKFCFMKYLFNTLKGSLTCREILYGTDGFISPPKEGVSRIFIVLGRI